jgi:hypothetical protein
MRKINTFFYCVDFTVSFIVFIIIIYGQQNNTYNIKTYKLRSPIYNKKKFIRVTNYKIYKNSMHD